MLYKLFVIWVHELHSICNSVLCICRVTYKIMYDNGSCYNGDQIYFTVTKSILYTKPHQLRLYRAQWDRSWMAVTEMRWILNLSYSWHLCWKVISFKSPANFPDFWKYDKFFTQVQNRYATKTLAKMRQFSTDAIIHVICWQEGIWLLATGNIQNHHSVHYFQMDFHEWKVLYDSNFIEVFPQHSRRK